MRIVVLGATGNVGSSLVRAGAEAGHSVRAVARRGIAGVDTIVADLNDGDSLAGTFEGVEGLFTLAGYKGLEGTLRHARNGGVRRVVLLSSSSAPSGRTDNAVAGYHLESERLVRESGLEWTFLRPNAFMSNALRWVPQLEESDTVVEPFGDVALSVVDPADIAAVALAALTEEGHNGDAYRLSGPESLTAAQRLEVIAAATGRDLTLTVPSDEEARRTMLETTPPQYVDAFFEFYRGGLIDETSVQPGVERVLGRRPGTFAAWVDANVAAFGGPTEQFEVQA